MTDQIETTAIHNKLTVMSNFSPEDIAVIQKTVAKNTTPTELAYFLNIAKTTGLNPFTKQIWCYKDNKNNVIIIAARDGFLSIAQKDPKWNGMLSSEVCKNDEFDVDILKGEIKHKPNFKDRGEIIGAYCYIKPKGVDIATFEYADIKVYHKGQYIWNSHTAEMIKKVAEVHALKKAFGISGLYCEDEIIESLPEDKQDKWRSKIQKAELNFTENEVQKEWRLKFEAINTGKELTEYIISVDKETADDDYFKKLSIECQNRIKNGSTFRP